MQRLQPKTFADTAQMQEAIEDIHRYQEVYKKAHDRDIVVKWFNGWYAIFQYQKDWTTCICRRNRFLEIIKELEGELEESEHVEILRRIQNSR